MVVGLDAADKVWVTPAKHTHICMSVCVCVRECVCVCVLCVCEPLHLLHQLLQAALELGTDGVGMVTACSAPPPLGGALLSNTFRVFQEQAGHHLNTHMHAYECVYTSVCV